MKWGVRWSGYRWCVYEVETGIIVYRTGFEFIARREASRLNERGV